MRNMMGNLVIKKSWYQILDTRLMLTIGWPAREEYVYISAIPKGLVSNKTSIQLTVNLNSKIEKWNYKHT